MKAIRVQEFGGPEALRFVEVEKPTVRPGQVLIQTKAIGVNPVDTYLRGGSNPNLARPYTVGLDAAGVIAEVGEGVVDLKPAARVWTGEPLSGAYAEFVLCNAANISPIPDNISFEQAAGLHVPYATAYRALFHRARAVPGETVFVHGGSGGVGIASIQWAKAHGLIVIATGGTEEGRTLAEKEGADHVLDHRAPDYLEQLTKITGGRGPDVILEMLANVNLGKSLGVLAKFGRIVVIGSRGKVEINPRDTMTRDADVLGVQLFNTPPAQMRSIHSAIVAGLRNGTLRPVVGKKFPLAEAAKAHETVMAPGAYGKIVLIP